MDRILVVEDERAMREIIRDYLTAHGLECDLARDGQEALELLEEQDYDAVVLDVLMPRLDGFGVCRAVRRQSSVPILFLTALGGEEETLRGYALGADDYVTKPFSWPCCWLNSRPSSAAAGESGKPVSSPAVPSRLTPAPAGVQQRGRK